MKNKNQFGYLLREVAIVAIGILIAVSIGNYREHAANEKYIEKTLLAIENEITVSQTEIDTVLNRHIKLYELLEYEIGQTEQTLGELVSSSGGFQVASIKNVSLRFFISNKAELLDFQLISQLLDIELKSDMLSDKINRLGDFAYDNVNTRDEEILMKFVYLLANVIDGEQTLIESYASFLEENKSFLERYK